jgi:hypothetical protein
MRRIIECDSCGFTGSLNYKLGDFNPSDISYCPACGGDIEEPYNLSEEDLDIDSDSA